MTAPISNLLNSRGSPVTIHVENNTLVCPCVTPEGYRDPYYHLKNPNAPECNDAGYISGGKNYGPYPGFVLPAQGHGNINWLTQVFGEIQTDDRIIVLQPPPIISIDFAQFDQSGENYVTWNSNNYSVVGNTLVPDPFDTTVWHHWELAGRIINPTKDF